MACQWMVKVGGNPTNHLDPPSHAGLTLLTPYSRPATLKRRLPKYMFHTFPNIDVKIRAVKLCGILVLLIGSGTKINFDCLKLWYPLEG